MIMLLVILKIEKHEPHKNAAVISGVMERLDLHAPLDSRDTRRVYINTTRTSSDMEIVLWTKDGIF